MSLFPLPGSYALLGFGAAPTPEQIATVMAFAKAIGACCKPDGSGCCAKGSKEYAALVDALKAMSPEDRKATRDAAVKNSSDPSAKVVLQALDDAEGKLPSWVVPAAIGGVLLVGAGWYFMHKGER